MIKQETLMLIKTILDSAPEITLAEKEQIFKVCRSKPRRSVISARTAMEILRISRPTLRAYVERGFLTQINMTARKVRFDQEQVEQFASYGNGNTEIEIRR